MYMYYFNTNYYCSDLTFKSFSTASVIMLSGINNPVSPDEYTDLFSFGLQEIKAIGITDSVIILDKLILFIALNINFLIIAI
jgi:hypothetical protein